MSRSLISGRPRLLHSCRHEANTSLSSRGKTLSRNKDGPGGQAGPRTAQGHLHADSGTSSGLCRQLGKIPAGREAAQQDGDNTTQGGLKIHVAML